jgi:hypothetical protein
VKYDETGRQYGISAPDGSVPNRTGEGGRVTEPGRTIATIGLLLVVGGGLGLRRHKPLRLLGQNLITVRGAMWALVVGILLLGMGLMVAYPETG